MDYKEFSEGTGSLKPGWMLKKDPELAKKLKDQQDRKKYVPAAPTKKEDMDEGMYSSDVERAFPNGKASGVKTHAPVAPVPDKKYIKGTPENKALKALRKPINGMPTNKMKEENMPQSFKGFLTSLTELTDKQKKHIDKNKNGKIDAHDFKLLQKEDELDELSKSTLGSYAKKATRDSTITRKIASDFEHMSDRARTPGMKQAAGMNAQRYKEKSWKRRDGLDKAVDRLSKEEVEMDEAMINGREYASHGLMHPDHANRPLHKVSGQTIDFYAHGSGDKVQGKVVYHDDKHVHIKDTNGKKHVFKISKDLPKTTNEDHKKDDVPFDGPYTKTPSTVKDKSGAVHGPMSRARDLARKAMQKKMKEEFNIEITEEQAAELCDTASLTEKVSINHSMKEETHEQDTMKSYKEFVTEIKMSDLPSRTVKGTSYGAQYHDPEGDDDADTKKSKAAKPADAPKRGRGRPSGSTSGAKQKGSEKSSNYGGIDRTTYALRLPNNNK